MALIDSSMFGIPFEGFYLPKEESGVVSIVRVIYGGRDMNKQLRETEI